ncbi:MAG: DNA mismatch repair endonuclease MutL [Bacteroidales bacterium]|nr:DNA mismatch repair endonuclease MutL [Bacteroidales bacterium]
MEQKNDVIKLLPDSVANQIAAGEVIQRPASVIKELVENAIDAGATCVDIVIKDAGKTLIQVIDNGCGMSPTDARMAFERHATSKIRKADDLFTLHTMGFRGEALPSVAAVSEIDLRTMREGDSLGTRLTIKASKVENQEPEVCARGTNIMVKNLFFNFVARRRFLKKDTIEMSHIMHEFERLVLVNTDVEFSLTHNGTVVHTLPRGPLKQRIGALFGRSVEKQLIPISTLTTAVKITGFIGLPANARQRNALQFFFVNGRNMRHPYFHKAVLNCYKDLIAGDAQPNYFINFEVEPDRIDVNIHPQKHEIKFEDEQMIWQILTAAVKESLGKFNVGPAIDFEATDVPEIPPLQQGKMPQDTPVDDFDPSYNPFNLQAPAPTPAQNSLFGGYAGMNVRHERRSSLNNSDWEKLYEGFISDRKITDKPPFNSAASTASATEAIEPDIAPEFSEAPMFQFKNRWIVTSTKGGLLIIDQHRAHVRILYDRLLPQIKSGVMTSQKLIFSEDVELDAAAHSLMLSAVELFSRLGFDIENKHGMEWTVKGIPAELATASPRETVIAILNDLADTGADPTDDQRQRIALSMAGTAAIRNNQTLTASEMQALVSDLLRLPSSAYTPDGHLIVKFLTTGDIASFFHK